MIFYKNFIEKQLVLWKSLDLFENLIYYKKNNLIKNYNFQSYYK